MVEKIAKWFAMGLWNAEMLQNAVEKGLLTQEQMRSLTENPAGWEKGE